jgi:hypothetical protein
MDETHNDTQEGEIPMLRDIFDKDGPSMVGMVLSLMIMAGFIAAACLLLVR